MSCARVGPDENRDDELSRDTGSTCTIHKWKCVSRDRPAPGPACGDRLLLLSGHLARLDIGPRANRPYREGRVVRDRVHEAAVAQARAEQRGSADVKVAHAARVRRAASEEAAARQAATRVQAAAD